MWLLWTASVVRLRRAAYKRTNCCPFSDFEETLCAQFCDGELSVWMSNFANFGIPRWNLLEISGFGGFSSTVAIVAVSCKMTTINSIILIWIEPLSIAVLVLSDQATSNQYWSS